MNKQMLLFLFGYFLPFLLTLSSIKGNAIIGILLFSNIGLLGMYILEIIAIRVEGARTYFSDKFNLTD